MLIHKRDPSTSIANKEVHHNATVVVRVHHEPTNICGTPTRIKEARQENRLLFAFSTVTSDVANTVLEFQKMADV